MNYRADSKCLQWRVAHRATPNPAAEPSVACLTPGQPGSTFVTVATSTRLPPDQEDAHADKGRGGDGESLGGGGWGAVRQWR